MVLCDLSCRSSMDISIRQKIKKVVENWADRSFWFGAAEFYGLHKGYYRKANRDPLGIDIMSAEWDTLIILDACRYDTFVDCQIDSWPEAIPIRSKAANTYNFYTRNFQGANPDTVAVTANPRTTMLRGDAFHDIVPVYDTDWNDKHGTVMPDVMAKRTIEAHQKYPDKRILSHWIQPHYPFVGSKLTEHAFDGEAVWNELQRGTVSARNVKEAYEECLEYTLPHVQTILTSEDVTGRIVVSSDHGNAFGESPPGWPLPVYGHPRGVLMEELVTVPWLIYETGTDRRKTVADKSREQSPSGDVEDRLADLGYV